MRNAGTDDRDSQQRRYIEAAGGPGDLIQLAHGEGGLLTRRLEEELFLPAFRNPALERLADASVLPLPGSGRLSRFDPSTLVITTDTFVVTPRRFPGGDIGRLAVCGTLNDLAVSGARPLALTVAFVIEEGLPLTELQAVVASIAATAREAGVPVVAGDTKVVGRGEADGLFVNTTGVGVLRGLPAPGADRIVPGDRVFISGDIGRHGVCVLSTRAGLEFEAALESDVAWVGPQIEQLYGAAGQEAVHAMRDPTRGGLATVVNELASSAGVGVILDEAAIPVSPPVAAAAEWFGLDPLYLSCEGRFVAFLAGDEATAAAARSASLIEIGRVVSGPADRLPRDQAACARPGGGVALGREAVPGPGEVWLRTHLGAHRPLELLAGAPLPRIC
ncbi:MAG TPA: hydrogenase expression/formation protein HypE [Firmicutes bacterium]|nr:hydrogenase expression/formation protein HypE [Bacillota bacterium]